MSMFSALCRPWICHLKTWLTMKFSFVDDSVDRRRYNAPTSSEVAGLMPGEWMGWRSSGFRPTEPNANRRAEFPVPSLWAKLLEEIRLQHSSTEQRPEIADVKNGMPGQVRSGSGPYCVWRSSTTFALENTH